MPCDEGEDDEDEQPDQANQLGSIDDYEAELLNLHRQLPLVGSAPPGDALV
jgi:hypothetical protein